MSGIPLGTTGQPRYPSQTPETSMIPEETELMTNSNETTQLLQKHKTMYGEPNGNVDGYDIIGEDDVNPRERRRAWSELAVMDEEMGAAEARKQHQQLFDVTLTKRQKRIIRMVKIATLFTCMIVMAIFFTKDAESETIQTQVAVSQEEFTWINMSEVNEVRYKRVRVHIIGNLAENATEPFLTVQLVRTRDHHIVEVVDNFTVSLIDGETEVNLEEAVEEEKTFKVPWDSKEDRFHLHVVSTTDYYTTVVIGHLGMPSSSDDAVICAAIILVGVYVLIGFELVHRTVAAMVGSFAALATLSAFNERPSMEVVMTWLDYETLALLWGMMTIVAIFSETGFFDWCALMSYKIAKGRMWVLITILCMFSGIVSAFLDNVTTILLLTPVTIRLCEVLDLDPKYVLIAEVLFSNIGGTATAIGDPPNVIIVSNADIAEAGIDFTEFTIHMMIGIVFCMAAGYGLLRLMYRSISLKSLDPPEIQRLRHETEIWRQAASRIMVTTNEENTVKMLLLQKVYGLESELRNKIYERKHAQQKIMNWEENLEYLEDKYKITDPILLGKSGFVLTIAIILFFIHSLDNVYLDLGWIAIIAAMALLVLSDINDMESIMHRVEWATLIFFAALFVLMEGLTELGLIDFIGNVVADLIRGVPEESQLTVAIILILWVSAIASSFIDNIPFTTAMVPVIVNLAEDPELKDSLPLKPMVWALAFGACLGGNGTLIGASANVVCAGIAEQHGYRFTFYEFFRVGFPMMLVTTAVAMIYLLICHSTPIAWNY
ncbi:P protein-like [Amphiura filiformis]|uniref:P protein-like n=1 Tax=Amphiura filiformis TaxID=82378 RepID=UPI003B212558